MNYYNENDPSAAAWLRQLILEGLIPAGDVDDRSITDITPDELKTYTQCHFFAGIGGWALALELAGVPSDTPLWTGSCPCQPYSAAGNRKGVDDERHLWPVWYELIKACQPERVFGEQVASSDVIGKVKNDDREVWLDAVHADLQRAHYASGFVCAPAASVGAPHIRLRSWFVAYSVVTRLQGYRRPGKIPVQERRERTHGYSTSGGDVDGLGDGGCESGERDTRKLPEEKTQAASQGCADGGHDHGHSDAGEVGSMGIANCGGRKQGGETTPRTRHRNSNDTASRSGGSGPINGLWSGADWLGCRDGKFRPVESGTFPLVDGVSERLGSGSGGSAPDIESTSEARVMRLRGYGNAIVPQVAAEFIDAVMNDE